MAKTFDIHHDPDDHKFAVTIKGEYSYLAYMNLGKQTLDVYRTYVPENLRGQGIAAALVERVLQYAEEHGYTIIPSCSYMEHYLKRKHGENTE